MNKTTAIAMIAALSAVAMIPAGSAELNARTFKDLAFGVEFGEGVGLYDPAGPTYCAALLSFYVGVSPVLFYYTTPVRYQPAVATSALVPVGGPGVADQTGCLDGTVPGNQVYADLVEVDAGSAVWSLNLLGTTQVANLGQTTVSFEYCAAPTAVPGTSLPTDSGVNVPGVGNAFTAKYVTCPAGWLGDYVLYNGAGACFVFTMTTAVGSLDGDQPVFLVDGMSCNTLVNSGSSTDVGGAGVVSLAALFLTGEDYAAQHCVETQATDTLNGNVTAEADSDFFVVGHLGPLASLGLLPWATTLGTTAPVDMFPNVANLEADAPAPSC